MRLATVPVINTGNIASRMNASNKRFCSDSAAVRLIRLVAEFCGSSLFVFIKPLMQWLALKEMWIWN
jgi:hypothetical protein